MKKSFLKITLLLLLSLVFTSSVFAQEKSPDKKMLMANQFVQLLTQNSYNKAFKICSPQIKEQIKEPAELEKTWNKIQGNIGKYKESKKPFTQIIDEKTNNYYYAATFEKGEYIIRVTVNEKEIIGFFVLDIFR